MINTKNITKIVESNQEILDKCAYWFDTEKEVLKRYTQGIWKPVCNSTGGSSFSTQAPLLLYTNEFNEKILKLNYDTTLLKLNDNSELTLKNSSSSGSTLSNNNGAITVKWCPRGKIDLDADLNKPCIIPPRKRCPMIRFSCRYLCNKYSLSTIDNFTSAVSHNYHDLVEANREEIMSKLLIEDLPLRSPFCCHGPVITWRIKGFSAIGIKTNCGNKNSSNSYYCINLDCLPSWEKTKVRIKTDPVVTYVGYEGKSEQQHFYLSPYITFVNPFTCYGGLIIVEKFNVSENGIITLKFRIERIPSNVTYYEPCIKQYIKYNEWGLQCNGSYTYKKRMIFFESWRRHFRQLGIVSMYQSHQTSGYVSVINNTYLDWKDTWIRTYPNITHLKTHKNFLPASVDEIVKKAKASLRSMPSRWARRLGDDYSIRDATAKFILQDIDLLYAGTRTQSEYAERYKVRQHPYIELLKYKYIGIV